MRMQLHWITLSLLLLLNGCAKNPVSGKNDFVMMSESQEMAIGRQSHQQLLKQQYQIYDNPELQAYVNRIGQQLARHSHRPLLQYQFTVLDSPEINAFALPGGYIYITRGILAYLNNEAELAAVLGHELGHVTARHGVRQQSAAQATGLGVAIASIFIPQLASVGGRELSNVVGGALLSGYGREHELEADRLGAEYLVRSGYDPKAIIDVVRVLKNQELLDAELAKQEGREPRRYHGLFATHPDNDTRLQQAIAEASNKTVANPKTGQEEFLRVTDKLIFNDNPEHGIIRNNRFLHGDLGFSLQFPPDWQIQNQPQAVIAIAPQGQAGLQMQLGDAQATKLSPANYLQQLSPNLSRIQSLDINGHSAAWANTPDAWLSVLYHQQQAFVFIGKSKKPPNYLNEMKQIVSSFNSLSRAEKQDLRPLRVRVITARSGDSWAKLAQQSPLGKSAEAKLRLINAQYPSGEPRSGQALKIIE